MNQSKRQLYANMEPFGESATRIEGGKRIYGGGGGGGQTSTTTASIAPEFKPLLDLYTQQATNVARTPFQAYGGQRFEDLSPDQQTAIGMVRDRATGGSQLLDQAEGGLSQFIQGGQTNPFLDRMVGKAQGSVVDQFNMMTKPQTEAAMVGSGSFGNTGYQQLMQNQQKAAGQQMSDIATQMYGQAYGQDQANRMTAIGMAPQFGNRAYQDAGQLMNVGGLQQQQGQQGRDFSFQQQQDAMNYPMRQLQATGSALQPGMGSRTETSGGGGK